MTSSTHKTAYPDRASIMDRHVGARIKQRRTMLGLSQQQLAERVGVTYQQEQRYERGQNRISAGRLHEMSIALAVPVSWFFEQGEKAGEAQAGGRERMRLELARNFASIDSRHQEALSKLARVLAHGTGSKP